MELITAHINNTETDSLEISESNEISNPLVQHEKVSTSRPFIEANTVESSIDELRHNHIIPVFIKDNEPVISQLDFIETTYQIAKDFYPSETILNPAVRLSHPIKGRIPEAKNKAAKELMEHERTLYYERMAFIIEIPSVYDEIDGNKLSLCVGGVKAYNLDNLHNRKGSDEHFKVFIGFQNSVCTNMCIWTDGFYSDLKVKDAGQLKACIGTLIESYNASFHLHQLSQLANYSVTENQFAHLIGKCRMYNHLPPKKKMELPQLHLGDSQINAVCKDYYRDETFCRDEHGDINLWKLYNLFTGANKSSYIDNFLDRSANAYHFAEGIKTALQKKENNWFLN